MLTKKGISQLKEKEKDHPSFQFPSIKSSTLNKSKDIVGVDAGIKIVFQIYQLVKCQNQPGRMHGKSDYRLCFNSPRKANYKLFLN